MTSHYALMTLTSIMTALSLVACIAALLEGVTIDEWATIGDCDVEFWFGQCKVQCLSDEMQLQFRFYQISSLFLLYLSLFIGIATLCFTKCCDERRARQRACCCLFVIPFLNVISSLFCFAMCLIVLTLCPDASQFGTSWYLSGFVGGILFCTSLTHICCYCNMGRIDDKTRPDRTNYQPVSNVSAQDEEAPIMHDSTREQSSHF